MAGIAAGISQTPIGVSYLITIIGIVTACAVFPVYSTILWSNQNKVAVIGAPILGSLTAIGSWLGSAYALFGEVTIASTSGIYPLVIGNSVSLVSGCVYSIAFTYIFGQDHFDWSALKTIKVVDDSDVKGLSKEQLEQQLAVEHLTPETERKLRKAKFMAMAIAAVLCGAFVILWPMPMYGSSYVFSKGFFRGWVVSNHLITSHSAISNLFKGRHVHLGLSSHYCDYRTTTLGRLVVAGSLWKVPSRKEICAQA